MNTLIDAPDFTAPLKEWEDFLKQVEAIKEAGTDDPVIDFYITEAKEEIAKRKGR